MGLSQRRCGARLLPWKDLEAANFDLQQDPVPLLLLLLAGCGAGGGAWKTDGRWGTDDGERRAGREGLLLLLQVAELQKSCKVATRKLQAPRARSTRQPAQRSFPGLGLDFFLLPFAQPTASTQNAVFHPSFAPGPFPTPSTPTDSLPEDPQAIRDPAKTV